MLKNQVSGHVIFYKRFPNPNSDQFNWIDVFPKCVCLLSKQRIKNIEELT